LWRRRSPEVVDPHAGINQNHGSILIASRSPCQLSFPRKRLISSCWRKRSSVRSPVPPLPAWSSDRSLEGCLP
jgi:hypothetical protein